MKKALEEKDQEGKAIVKAEIIKETNGLTLIRIRNTGNYTARKLKIVSHDDNFLPPGIPSSIDLKPQTDFDILIKPTADSPKKALIALDWSDDYSEHNIEI